MVGVNVIALTNLFTLSCRGYRVKMRNCTVSIAAARCRGAIQPGIFTAQTCCVSSSQRQGIPAPVLCHRHHLPAGRSYMIRMKTSQKQARKTYRVNILYTHCIRRVLRSSFLQRTACTHLSWSFFSERPEICTLYYVLTKGVIMNVNG